MRRQYARLERERTEHLMFGAIGWVAVLGISFFGMDFVRAEWGSGGSLITLGFICLLWTGSTFGMLYLAYLKENLDEDPGEFTWSRTQVIVGSIIFVLLTSGMFGILSARITNSIEAETTIEQEIN